MEKRYGLKHLINSNSSNKQILQLFYIVVKCIQYMCVFQSQWFHICCLHHTFSISTNSFLTSWCPSSSVQQILPQIDIFISDWNNDFSSYRATHRLFGLGVVTLPFCASVCFLTYLDFPFLCIRDCLFAQVSGAQQEADLNKCPPWL